MRRYGLPSIIEDDPDDSDVDQPDDEPIEKSTLFWDIQLIISLGKTLCPVWRLVEQSLVTWHARLSCTNMGSAANMSNYNTKKGRNLQII